MTESAPNVRIRFFAAARAHFGINEIELQATCLDEVLSILGHDDKAGAGILQRCSFLLNETALHDMATEFNDGDVVDVLPPFAGG